MTFRGHRVLKTLIRCHFSPATSTDQRYIYSGSHDGRVHIWNLDGTPRAQIDVQSATMNSRPAADERYADRYPFAEMVSHEFGLADAETAMRTSMSADSMKVAIVPGLG